MKGLDDTLRRYRGKEYDAGAHAQRTESCGDKWKNVREGKNGENAVVRRHFDSFDGALDFVDEIAQREFHALRIARGPGRVDDQDGILG